MTDARQLRRVVVPLIDRANYGRMKPVLAAVQEHDALQLQVVCSGSMVLERFGTPMHEVEADGFPVAGAVYIEVEGSVPSTMAKSVGMGVIEFASEFQRLQPDVILAIGDRYEMMSAVMAAACMNIPVAHIQGGEVSGSIDENIRHAITKFSHAHFPATERAAEYLVRMGESPDVVHHVGCPSSDIARVVREDNDIGNDVVNGTGAGAAIDVEQPFALVVFHPVTTHFGHETEPVDEILGALEQIKMPTLWLWPNIDAGSDHISKVLRQYRENHHPSWLRLVKNYSPRDYAVILSRAAVGVGNSSSFVRDSGFYGTPIVLVGARQEGREYSHNVTVTQPQRDQVLAAVKTQLGHGRYEPATLYGDGFVAQRIADKLAAMTLSVQKKLHYIHQ